MLLERRKITKLNKIPEGIEDMKWDTTPNPWIELLRKKEAEFNKESAINKYIVGCIVTEMVEKIVPMSISNNIIDILIDNSFRLGRMEVLWKEMVDDDQFKDDIKMKVEEEDRANIQDALSKASTQRLELKEEKVKLWKEKAKMMNLMNLCLMWLTMLDTN